MMWVVGAVAWLILAAFVSLGLGRMIWLANRHQAEQPARPVLTLVGS